MDKFNERLDGTVWYWEVPQESDFSIRYAECDGVQFQGDSFRPLKATVGSKSAYIHRSFFYYGQFCVTLTDNGNCGMTLYQSTPSESHKTLSLAVIWAAEKLKDPHYRAMDN